MSRLRKHVSHGAEQLEVGPLAEGQAIVRALGSRGSNIVEVEYPNGRQTLVIMPAKFNKMLWVRRGGFLIVEDSAAAEADTATQVTGTIRTVLYSEHIKELLKLPGVWPSEFAPDAKADAPEEGEDGVDGLGPGQAEEDSDDDGLPPLQPNTNRKVVCRNISDDDDDESD